MTNFKLFLLASAALVASSIFGSADARLPVCTSQETAADTCWKSCLLGGNCDVPDPDVDKTCAEENAILDEAEACCSQCSNEVEAIRACRCPSSEGGGNAETDTTVINEGSPQASAPLPLCTSQETAAASCWKDNKSCLLDDNCDVPDPDVDKTCAEENTMLDEAKACCSGCSDAVEAIRACRCPSESEAVTVESQDGTSSAMQAGAASFLSFAIMAGAWVAI